MPRRDDHVWNLTAVYGPFDSLQHFRMFDNSWFHPSHTLKSLYKLTFLKRVKITKMGEIFEVRSLLLLKIFYSFLEYWILLSQLISPLLSWLDVSPLVIFCINFYVSLYLVLVEEETLNYQPHLLLKFEVQRPHSYCWEWLMTIKTALLPQFNTHHLFNQNFLFLVSAITAISLSNSCIRHCQDQSHAFKRDWYDWFIHP